MKKVKCRINKRHVQATRVMGAETKEGIRVPARSLKDHWGDGEGLDCRGE